MVRKKTQEHFCHFIDYVLLNYFGIVKKMQLKV